MEETRIRAVIAVESRGNGFLPDGRPTILFEGQVFWRELKNAGQYPGALIDKDSSLNDILHPAWSTSHHRGGAAEYGRLERAQNIHKQAAPRSASWAGSRSWAINARPAASPTWRNL